MTAKQQRRFIRAAALWLLPSEQRFDLLRLYAVGLVVGFFYLYLGNFAVENGAANYTDWAEALVRGATLNGNTGGMAYRDIGLPLMLVLSGYTLTHSLVAVTIIQFLMALAIPLLSYLSLSPWLPRAAYYIAFASILSLGPFLLFKTIQHDEPYLFFTMLSLYFTNHYLATRRAMHILTFSLSSFAFSLIRNAGKTTFPLLIVVGLFQGPKRPRNYFYLLTSVILFYGCTIAYETYRSVVLEYPHTILGQQVFQNIYVNGNDYGVTLSPSFGPHVKALLDRIRARLLSGIDPKTVPDPPPYDQEFFLRYTPQELANRMIAKPTFDYYFYILGLVDEDNDLLFRASIETALARPVYVMHYFLRNCWEILVDPGWQHGRFTDAPQIRGGLLFPFGGVTQAGRGTIGDRLPQPALSEASFIPLERQPLAVRWFYTRLELVWALGYHPVTEGLFAGILVAWAATLVGVVERVSGRLEKLAQLLLADRVLPASLAISALLVANVVTTAAVVEPLYRYDYALVSLKVLLAGVGFTVAMNLMSTLVRGAKYGNL